MRRDIELMVRGYSRRVTTLGKRSAMYDADLHDDPDAITAAETPIPLQQERNPRRSGTYIRTELDTLAEVVALRRSCFK